MRPYYSAVAGDPNAMAFWMTTHWPRREDRSLEEPRYGVWVQNKKKKLIDRVSPGDLVFIYETKSGPAIKQTYVDGSVKSVRRHPGGEGIVALVEVTEVASQPEDSQPEEYADGSKLWWRYCAPTRSINSGGFIPREEVSGLLGYDNSYNFHGFGEKHSGLKEITADLFDQILDRFSASTCAIERKRIEHLPPPKFGGEGPEHKALKLRIANDPAGVLGETGLTLWKTEWPLPTGDRIDLVLKDALGRFVAVEVEVNCERSEIAGPLQCMKYRAMLSYLFNRPLEEFRCILVAHSIHADVCGRCATHTIGTKVVPAA